MSNFDLRKYLAESKLVTEDKIDMINKYAHRIATGEEIQDEFFMDNKEEILQAADEIEKYMGSDADIPEAQKPSMKMKKSELKEMIKAAFLSEADFTNAQDDDAALGGMYDPVYEAEDEEYDYDDYDLNVEFKKSPNEASYEDVLDIIKSYEDEIILDDFKSEFPKGEPISKKDYSDFATRLIDDMSEVGFIQANWISIFDEDVFDKAGLVEGEDEEETAEREETAEEILARITGTKLDPYSLAEAKDEEEETDVTVDAEEETTDGGEEKLANDSIVVDKKIVSLSSLPQQTRKILDSLETLRAQAEEFGDQKFITQVGNTITFFTRDFVVAGDEPTKAKVDESLEILKMKKLAGLLTEGEYAKALLKEIGMEASFLPVDPVPGTAELTSNLFNSLKNKLMASGEKIINKVPKDELMAMKSAAEKVLGPGFGKEDITMDNAEKVGKVLMSRLNEGNIADTIGSILAFVGMGAGTFGFSSGDAPVAIAGLVAMILGYIIGRTFGDDNDISIDRGI